MLEQRVQERDREAGRQRSRRFATREQAVEFEERLRSDPLPPAPPPDAEPAGGNGIYAYDTTEGLRYRFAFRQSDGTQSSCRGFTSRRAAATARRRLVESIERGEVKVARESFGDFWARFLEERRPYLTSGSMVDL